MTLWVAVVEELTTAQAFMEAKERAKAQEYWNEKQVEEDDTVVGRVISANAEGHDLTAMAWVNERTTKQRDQFKTLRNFQRAWQKFCVLTDQPLGIPNGEEVWNQFLEYRKVKRLTTDAARQRKGRMQKKTQGKESRKIASGGGR